MRFRLWILSCAFLSSCGMEKESVSQRSAALTRSSAPPGGLQPSQVPQLVAVTFDDNFNAEGMDWATGFFRPLVNSSGSGNPGTFDGTPVRTTFPSNSVYLSGMQASWQTAVNDGHEFANHTVDHSDGISFSVAQWNQEISNCTTALVGGLNGGGHSPSITGFRSPYLHYDDNLFTALTNNSLIYDTSIMGCWADAENGTNCPWPYTLESGSPDADTIFNKWSGRNVVPVTAHPGLWELPVAVVFVPDDSLATQYGFPTGLRQRTQNLLGSAQNPNFFEQSTGKMVGMDITLLLDGKMSKAEALATLKYTLDLRLQGNRAPLVFVAHTHVYASNWDGNAPNASNTLDRRSIIEDFVNYALSKPEVRIRPLADVLAWMKTPVALGACTPTTCAAKGKNCGSISDGCGKTLSCGSCGTGQSCNNNVCQACTPTTCAAQGKTCGTISDGCGNSLSCGSCPTGQTCTASNVCQSASTCNPTVASYQQGRCNATAVYSGKLYKCISQAVNVNGETAGCGTTGVYCSTIAPDNAAWGSTAWQPLQSCNTSCTPTTCAAQGKTCGNISDGCGATLSCGSCPTGQTCSSNNVCQNACTPTTCAAQGKTCGNISDGCGATLSCGSCPTGQTCSTNNVCQSSSGCTPSVASYSQATCSATAVYNGKLYKCISQAAGVNGEPSGCGTTGVYCSSIPPDNVAWGSTAWQLVQSCN
jgi:peptidoglycan/xylan/chitin deacetylase (PgdA/CDA1 family)